MRSGKISCLRRKPPSRDQVPQVMSKMEHIHLVGAAEARHRLYQRFENRLEVDQRPADHLEHVGSRGLLLKRFLQIPVRACTSSNSRVFSMAITA